ncbi:hypothetical protein LDVICp060 [lymphocystis disease virus-China]|uniref:Uncharacterized protein n=1 Tax=lymphocystis disease virus-China TaxID=256729 RepID=Q678F1_9VIRU|nr:hypothetical protein LDVICp060 [lymphocystis disease virus-China]AAU10906.1 hypothetical protein [lymphocystis disease virus-China]
MLKNKYSATPNTSKLYTRSLHSLVYTLRFKRLTPHILIATHLELG